MTVSADSTCAEANLRVEKEAEVTFRNEMTQYEKFSHMTSAMNILSAKTKLTGLTITYKGLAIIESATEDAYTFTADDLEAIASYDDGTTDVIPFDKLKLDPASVTGNNNTSGAGFTIGVNYTENGITVSDSFSVGVHLQKPAVPHTINYDANGGYFSDSVTVNPMTYVWKTEKIPYTEKISKTKNVSEDGNSSSGGYGNNKSSTDTITITGAETLHVKITYETESTSCDWVVLYDKDGRSISGKLGGQPKTTQEFDITGDTVRIYFRSDGSVCDLFGYYAVVSTNAHDFTKNFLCSGSYIEPDHQEKIFLGWYTDSACTNGNEYVFNEFTELTENITVYAKWKVPTAMFDTGKNVNEKIKTLSGQSHAYNGSPNKTITSIQKANVRPDLTTMSKDNIVSTTTSDVPIYVWFDKGIIYWWSKAKNVYLNQNSSRMFANYDALTNLDLSSFDTSKVATMGSMFLDCNALTNLDLSSFKTSNVTDMSWMFNGCKASSLNLSSFNTSNVTNMSSMFEGCDVSSLDLSSFDTSNVTNMSSMFEDCDVSSLDLSSFDTSNVTNMKHMFRNCKASNLDVSSFNTSKIMDMSMMFYHCQSLTSLDLSSFNTSQVTDMSDMFSMEDTLSTWSVLTSLDVSSFDTSNVTDMSSMFKGCKALTSLDVSDFNTNKVTSMGSMFEGCYALTNLKLSSDFKTSKVTDMSSMFSNCHALTNLDLSKFNTSQVTTMHGMFNGCHALTNLKLSNDFKTSKVTDMRYMFSGCKALTNLDLSNFDTSKVTNMSEMFYNCKALTSLNLSSFDTSKVATMGSMFDSCGALTNLDLSSFDTSKVTNMKRMFLGCRALTTIKYGPNFTNTANPDTSYMFYRCPANRPAWLQ